MSERITIVGGGLCGLALANGLRKADIPVRLFEAGNYPRHRVCGEMLAGIQPRTLAELGIESCFESALRLESSLWFSGGKPIREYALPESAPSISRYVLDARMADIARQRGAEIIENERVKPSPTEGTVYTSGRIAARGGFHGLKGHWSQLSTSADLELHLGTHCYIGLSSIENGAVNACGLFRSLAQGNYPTPLDRFYATLRQNALGYLAERLENAEFCEGSFCSVAGLSYRRPEPSQVPSLGDHFRQIPPFTGNGMTMALENAACALPHLVKWSMGSISWSTCMQACDHALRRRFRHRFLTANLIHPLLLNPSSQFLLALLCRSRLLPFTPLYRLTHA